MYTIKNEPHFKLWALLNNVHEYWLIGSNKYMQKVNRGNREGKYTELFTVHPIIL